MIGRLGLPGLALLQTALLAAPYQPPVGADPKAPPIAWFAKKARAGIWCSFGSLKAFQAALDSRKYSADDRAIVWAEGGHLWAIGVANDSEDAFTSDAYYLDQHQKLTRMVRTGRYIESPLFSVTYVPDRTGRLVMTPASREVIRRMEQAEYESYVIDWPKFSSFDRMPFRNLIQFKPVFAIRKGCVPAPH